MVLALEAGLAGRIAAFQDLLRRLDDVLDGLDGTRGALAPSGTVRVAHLGSRLAILAVAALGFRGVAQRLRTRRGAFTACSDDHSQHKQCQYEVPHEHPP